MHPRRALRPRPSGLHWWRNQSNLSVAHFDRFLCNHVLPSFLQFGLFGQLTLASQMIQPLPNECSVAFTDVGKAWRGDAIKQFARTKAWPSNATRVAVCIQGGVRSFTHPEVYKSIRDNAVRSLRASYLRVFYVLNLTSDDCSWCAKRSFRTTSLGELLPAIDAVGHFASLSTEPSDCGWPELRSGLSYADCFIDMLAGPVQFRGKEMCEADIRQYEVAYGVTFDWVLWARPDLKWVFPIGDIRRFRQGHVYAPKIHYTELSDLIALIPREFMAIYSGAFRDWSETNGSKFHCITTAEIIRARRGRLCDFPGFADCIHCWFGSIGCLLEAHLKKHKVPLAYIPEEITARTPRWMMVSSAA
ncbi:unnamed protein product [Polarella glacialis]|uniref:Uncharacterized protein n=1 Tax=Polarella glacialis TaxID=89957 RepID=A0A813EAW6_POLGL|nr:unnamed protein product [Polarella glacialis]